MASKWRTALVEPPSAITTVIAFSKAFLVMMSNGRMPPLSMSMTAAPARRQSSFLASEMAFWAELLGRLIPKASIALAIVLAVYIPPHDPGPGIAQDSM